MTTSTDAPPSPSRRELLTSALCLGTISAGAAALAACGNSGSPAGTSGVGIGATTGGGATGTTTGSSAGGTSGGTSGGTTTLPAGNFRVDVHCHHIPDFYRASLASNGIATAGGIPIPPWTPELAINFMNDYGIQMQVLSISEPGVYYLADAAARVTLAMQLNDFTANLINGIESVPGTSTKGTANPLYTNRFGGFGVLPLGDLSPTDLSNAVTETNRALTTLGMDGIGLYSNYNGTYLGDPKFAPLFAELDALGAIVFLHPVLPGGTVPNVPTSRITFLYEFPFDTTRAVANMLYEQVFNTYPNIRWIIAHAGGCIPFLSYRTGLLTVFPAVGQSLSGVGLPVTGAGPIDENGPTAFKGLFYDTALSPAPCAMQSVRAVADPSHVLFATDWPFSAPVFVVPGDPAPQLPESFDNDELLGVLRDNALAQFPRVRAVLGS